MPDNVITSLEEVAAAWLTAALSATDALTSGAVIAFEADAGGGNWSANAILKLQYSAGATGKLPRSLFLKMVDAGASSANEFFGASEVTYYTHDYIDVPDAPIIRCYSGAFSEEQQRYHILLDDLSQSHIEASQKAPSLAYGLALADGLAAMHARWWAGSGLAEAAAPMHNAAHIRRFVEIAEPGAGHIIDAFSAELKPHWPELIRQLYARHPQAIVERTADDNGFTLIHGDAGDTNILVPRAGERPIYIIDRQPFDWSLTTWLGAYDLAYAMVLDWPVEARRELELAVLRRYHEQLASKGVADYSWQRLLDDYRLCVAMGVYIATEYCRGGINESWTPRWLPMLKRALTACDDLQCSELW